MLLYTGEGSFLYLTGYDQTHVRIWDPSAAQSMTIPKMCIRDSHSMDGGHIVGDLVDTCVVAGIKTHQKAGIINVWKIFQYFCKDTRSQFGCSAGRGGHLSKGQFFCHL